MQRSVSIYGSSSALRGVQLKIGEKFKPPAKVTLPMGWKTRDPSQILGLTYDFSLEEEVIRKVEDEKQAKEQELSAQKAKELLKVQPSTPVIAHMGGDILLPTTVSSAGTNNQKENKAAINYKDFEGDSDTPFELVELQSINNMDALKSVLQPELRSDAPATSVTTPADDVPSDGNTATTSDPQATSGNPFNPMGTGTTTSGITFSNSLINPSVSLNIPPQYSQNGYPGGDTVTNAGVDTRQDLNPFAPHNAGLPTMVVDNQPPVSNINTPVSQQQNTSVSSASNTSLQTNRKPPMSGAIRVLPVPALRSSPRGAEDIVNEQSNMVPPSALNDGGVLPSTKQKRPVPKPRNKLAPLKNTAGPSEAPPPLPPKKQKSQPIYDSVPNTPVSMDEKLLKRYSSPLPPISPPATANVSSTIPDPCSSMSSEERELVKKVSSMGFPTPRVARAVKNLGCKENEVLEFLISVNDMCNLGYSENQVEMVLKDKDSDQDTTKAKKFLSLIAQFKELGFQEEKIFDALKKSECDSNKTLDILTCAG